MAARQSGLLAADNVAGFSLVVVIARSRILRRNSQAPSLDQH